MRAWPRFLLGRGSAGELYDLRGDGAIEGTGETPVVNMGYWADLHPREPRSLERANYAMFDLVIRGADAREGHHVVDAGCGFGTNAIQLASTTGARVTGVNVSAVQLATAATRVAAAGLSGAVDLHHGSVLALRAADASVDAVVSVEAAFHFDPRRAFFAEAYRVLKPGGRLSVVDLVVPPPRSFWQRLACDLICRSQSIPGANLGDRDAWLADLRAAGFVVRESESIVDRVFPAFRRWMLTRPPGVYLRYDLAYIAASLPYLVYPFDYVRVVAEKPR